MNLSLVKSLGSIMVSVGVGSIVNNAIKSTTPATSKGISKLFIWVGGLALTGMVAGKAKTYFETGFDEVFSKEDDCEKQRAKLKLV